MIDSQIKLRISDEVISQEIDGEIILLDMQGEEYFGLNEVGTRVWQLLKKPTNLEKLFSIMKKEYDVKENILRDDLNDIVTQLLSAGLIKKEESNSYAKED